MDADQSRMTKLRLTGLHACVRLLLAATLPAAPDPSVAKVLVVVNRREPLSAKVADYYLSRRPVPPSNVCSIETTTDEEIPWRIYEKEIEQPIADCLKKPGLTEQVFYIVLTMGVPLKIDGLGMSLEAAEHASVDSELTLLYAKLKGQTFRRAGVVPNPFFMRRDTPFGHPQFPIYLVTRLAANDLSDVKAMIDRSLLARNRGKFVIDLNSAANNPANNWLRNAAMLLPADRVVLDETDKVLYGEKDVIAYASWGSNDPNRKQRWLGFQWLPGAIATEYVSTNARSLRPPPSNWNIGSYQDAPHWFAGSPQSLTADLIHEGATGVSGNVYEPFVSACARPDLLLPAWFEGRNLAESFYLSLPYLSWQGVVLGDPLCSLGKPGK
jgi:uncharacterized protein (TIGR03790 family)